LSQSLDEIGFVKSLVESATAATASTKGDTEKGKITLGEVELTLQAAKERISSISKFYVLAQKEFGQKWSELVNANAGKLKAVTLYKKSHKGNYFKKTLKPEDWRSADGYTCNVVSTMERQQKNLESVQKLNAVASQFPGNIPLAKIKNKKLLEFADLNPDEIKNVMDFEDQKLKSGAMPQPQPQPAQPLTPPQNAQVPQLAA